ASDFYGPRVRAALAGKLMVPRLLAGKSVQTLGRLDQLHSFTYVPDLAAAMIAAADQPQAWNRVLHAPTGPALTQRDLVRTFAEGAASTCRASSRYRPGCSARSGWSAVRPGRPPRPAT